MSQPLPAPESLLRAGDLSRAGRYAEAETLCRSLLAGRADDLQIHEHLVVALYGQQRLADAVAHYRSVVHLDPYPCDAEYDALYMKALLATRVSPSPFKRRGRFFRLITLLRKTLARPGAVAECGCYRGMSSYLICGTIRQHDASFSGRGYHVFDSFEGLSAPTLDDEVPDGFSNAERLREMCQTGAFAATLAEVRGNLADHPEIDFHPGWIPFSFKGIPETRYKFVHLDVDLYDPTFEALEYFLPRMAAGGLIVSDDYSWPGARRAIEEFCEGAGIPFTVTEHQQAVISPG